MHRTQPRSWMAVLAAVVLLVVGSAGPAVAKGKPSSSGKATYVAMGDSYASGNGTFNPDLDADCFRSSDAYAPLVAKQLRRTTLAFVACSGADTSDMAAQAAALSGTTTYVTISVGGNDIGFTDLITACVTSSDSACAAAVDTADAVISGGDLRDRLDDVYAHIGLEAPKAKVVVVGYPRGFDPGRVWCFQAYGISPEEAVLLNGVSDDINEVIEKAAAAAGFAYVDPNQTFAGHDVCASTPYLNGIGPALGGDSRNAYHPTKAGHAQGFEPLVYEALTGR